MAGKQPRASDNRRQHLIESLEAGDYTFEIGARLDDMTADITGREPDNTIYRNTIRHRNFTGTAGMIRTPRGFFVYFIYDQANALFGGGRQRGVAAPAR